MQERPCGYFTDSPEALGDSIIVPVSIMNFQAPLTLTINLSRFRGAGPA